MPLPQRIMGRDIFSFLTASGLMYKTVNSRLGLRLKGRDTLIGSSPRAARRLGTRLRGRAEAATGRTVTFADRTRLDVDTVIWATGFGTDHSWVDVPVFDSGGDGQAPAWGHLIARSVLPRSALAAHPGLGAARLGQG